MKNQILYSHDDLKKMLIDAATRGFGLGISFVKEKRDQEWADRMKAGIPSWVEADFLEENNREQNLA